jgi:mono/diheme cytochrome c family protein
MKMNGLQSSIAFLTFSLALAGCANAWEPLAGYEQVTPAPVGDLPVTADASLPAETAERGRYLVGLLGCGNCHTDGALIGAPDSDRVLAGSSVGIAWGNPLEQRNPGVVYPGNLTPDVETGIGGWTEEQIVAMLRSGIDAHGGRALAVMPWLAYSKLTEEDAAAIALYLRSLAPIVHEVPDNVRPGKRARHPFVHFGVYRSSR